MTVHGRELDTVPEAEHSNVYDDSATLHDPAARSNSSNGVYPDAHTNGHARTNGVHESKGSKDDIHLVAEPPKRDSIHVPLDAQLGSARQLHDSIPASAAAPPPPTSPLAVSAANGGDRVDDGGCIWERPEGDGKQLDVVDQQ